MEHDLQSPKNSSRSRGAIMKGIPKRTSLPRPWPLSPNFGTPHLRFLPYDLLVIPGSHIFLVEDIQSSPMLAQSRLPKIGEVTGVDLPVTHFHPRIENIAEGWLAAAATVRWHKLDASPVEAPAVRDDRYREGGSVCWLYGEGCCGHQSRVGVDWIRVCILGVSAWDWALICWNFSQLNSQILRNILNITNLLIHKLFGLLLKIN